MLDTHAIARTLTRAGLTAEQADVITDAVRQAAEHDTETLSTKADLHALKADLHALEARLTWRFAWAMPLQTFAILGAVFAMLRLLA